MNERFSGIMWVLGIDHVLIGNEALHSVGMLCKLDVGRVYIA